MKISRRKPFRIEHIPRLARLYAYPLERYNTPGKQALYGAPAFALYALAQRLPFIKSRGIFTINDHKITFNAKNTQFSSLYLKHYQQNGYESATSCLIDFLLKPNDTFYDIGSNWGYFALFVASNPLYKGEIYAFEPYKPSFDDLVSCIEQSGYENIQCFNVAVSDNNNFVSVILPDYFQSGMAISNKGGDIMAISLDECALIPPNIIKIDVENFELNVLKGADKLISTYHPHIIFENARKIEPLKLLFCKGYKFYSISFKRFDGFLVEDDPISDELILTEFDMYDRLILPHSMNIFACHRKKSNKIKM